MEQRESKQVPDREAGKAGASCSSNSTGSTLRERDYIGIYEVSSREKQEDGNPEQTSFTGQVELRLGLSDTAAVGVKRVFTQMCSEVVENSKSHFLQTNHTQREPVGWPPVQSFRKSTLVVPQRVENKTLPDTTESTSRFVKVNMDGVPIGRKVEVMSCNSYENLTLTIEEMFQHHINVSKDKLATPHKLNFIDSDYVLAYEDKDGDLMLVGDVPWRMFIETVKRLRIMKGTNATGLAPRTALEVA